MFSCAFVVALLFYIVVSNSDKTFSGVTNTLATLFFLLLILSIILLFAIVILNPFKKVSNKYRNSSTYRWLYGGAWFKDKNGWFHHSEFPDSYNTLMIIKIEICGTTIRDDEDDPKQRNRNYLINKILKNGYKRISD